mmetsp:Transcript_26789/g.58415  ORF Transcript_26789/g.58415 Transcript_26789/m.58415 type:complete len:284 (+) Transcript_26789:2-853(+)
MNMLTYTHSQVHGAPQDTHTTYHVPHQHAHARFAPVAGTSYWYGMLLALSSLEQDLAHSLPSLDLLMCLCRFSQGEDLVDADPEGAVQYILECPGGQGTEGPLVLLDELKQGGPHQLDVVVGQLEELHCRHLAGCIAKRRQCAQQAQALEAGGKGVFAHAVIHHRHTTTTCDPCHLLLHRCLRVQDHVPGPCCLGHTRLLRSGGGANHMSTQGGGELHDKLAGTSCRRMHQHIVPSLDLIYHGDQGHSGHTLHHARHSLLQGQGVWDLDDLGRGGEGVLCVAA